MERRSSRGRTTPACRSSSPRISSLDRGTLGLMGSAFFYSYALFQMPWGIASDRFGSRPSSGAAFCSRL